MHFYYMSIELNKKFNKKNIKKLINSHQLNSINSPR